MAEINRLCNYLHNPFPFYKDLIYTTTVSLCQYHPVFICFCFIQFFPAPVIVSSCADNPTPQPPFFLKNKNKNQFHMIPFLFIFEILLLFLISKAVPSDTAILTFEQ